MSVATANRAAIQTMRLAMPPRGGWTAEVEADMAEAPAIGAAMLLEVGGSRFMGTVTRTGADGAGSVSFTVAGGAGKLGTVLEPKSFGPSTVETLLGELLGLLGEARSSSISSSVLQTPLPRWGRARVTGKAALGELADKVGATWRVLDDGSIWMGTDAGDEPALEHDVLDERPQVDVLVVGLEKPGLRPGQTFRRGPVGALEYRLSGSRLEASVSRDAKAKDRKAAAQIDKALAPTKWHPPRPARVVSQNADGTLELAIEVPSGKPADVAPVSRVPVRHGLPGVVALELEKGARVALCFEDGDPTKPFAGLFIGGRIVLLELDVDEMKVGGSEAVAKAMPISTWANSVEARFAALGAPGAGPVGIEATKLFTE